MWLRGMRMLRLALLLRLLVGTGKAGVVVTNPLCKARRPHVGRMQPQDRCASYVIAVYRVVVDSCPRETTLGS